MDENGNPFALGVNGPSISLMPQFLPTRTSPPTTVNSGSSTVSAAPTASTLPRLPRGKAKKRGKDGDAVLSDDLPGHLGDRVINPFTITANTSTVIIDPILFVPFLAISSDFTTLSSD